MSYAMDVCPSEEQKMFLPFVKFLDYAVKTTPVPVLCYITFYMEDGTVLKPFIGHRSEKSKSMHSQDLSKRRSYV